RRDGARRADARDGRARGLAHAPPRGQPPADPDADRSHAGRGPRRGPRRRRRRLPDEALRARGAPRACACTATADERGLRRAAAVLGPRARPAHARGDPRRRQDRADAHRVLAARAVHAQPAAGAHPLADLRARLGLRLRLRVELARRLHRLPAPQDRSCEPAAADPHGPRRGLRAARGMSLRTRLALVAAAAVGIAVVAASVVAYIVVHEQLRGEVDHTLQSRVNEINAAPFPITVDPNGYLKVPDPGFGVESSFVQAIFADGSIRTEQDAPGAIPVNGRDEHAVNSEGGRPYFEDKTVHGTKYRVLTFPGQNIAVQVYRPLTAVDHTLHRITFFLILIAVGGMGVAAALGLLVSRAALTPVRRLTHT